MKLRKLFRRLIWLMIIGSVGIAMADPCGMVPPVYQGAGVPIARIGQQQTYVFFKDGVESFVIRPGYRGKVDEFGMLIPFPSPPAVRKVADNIFSQIDAAVDPPEVVINLYPQPMAFSAAMPMADGLAVRSSLSKSKVTVISREAVGMYDVVVLEAGSADALKKWMDKNGFKFPNGMEPVCEEYVQDRWCFVAVKTKVAEKSTADPQPGQRRVATNLPKDSTFDGHVQAMGFRFKTDELVVPMRLSAFNGGDLRNIVYLLTDGPKRVRNIPKEFVVRQVKGKQLVKNLNDPLPLRIIGGTEKDMKDWHRQNLDKRRDPTPKNGAAKQLFSADLVAVQSSKLTLAEEQKEKDLLAIGERLGLRGNEIDVLNAEEMKSSIEKTNEKALEMLAGMTLTVVDGDFPREVIAGENLTFSEFSIPQSRNNSDAYDTMQKGPNKRKKRGELILKPIGSVPKKSKTQFALAIPFLGLGLASVFYCRRWRGTALTLLIAMALLGITSVASAQTVSDLVNDLSNPKAASKSVEKIVNLARRTEARNATVESLVQTATNSDDTLQRGWAIIALGEIGGMDVDESLIRIHQNEKQSKLVRTWAASARVAMNRSAEALIEKAHLINQFPALGRPISVRLVESLSADKEVTVERLLQTTIKVPQVSQALTPMILSQDSGDILKTMISAKDQNIRRQAAAFLGALAADEPEKVGQKVIDTYTFKPGLEDVPWAGGPLFIPGIDWSKEAAGKLVRELMAWNVWADQKRKSDLQRQIHNNLRSVGLSRKVGYRTPNFQFASAAEWLKAWGATAGTDAVRELLNQQGLADRPEYRAAQ